MERSEGSGGEGKGEREGGGRGGHVGGELDEGCTRVVAPVRMTRLVS